MSSPPRKPLVFIISAPSGSGKSTLVNELVRLVSDLEFSISYTTRSPRGSEQNGRQYFFITRAEFDKMVRENEFLEYAEVHDNCYGTAKRFLHDAERNGRDLLLDIDVQGAAQIQKKLPAAISIFILPPNRKILEERLRKRSEDSERVIQSRLEAATREIENYGHYNYILVNDRLDDSVNRLEAIVLGERLLRSGKSLSSEEAKIVNIADCCRLANIGERLKPILASFKASAASESGRPW